MTEALFLETAQCEEQLLEQKGRRLNVSGVLKILGVSRSGYLGWKKILPSEREKRKQAIKERILEIYNESHQNYGAPKITQCLQREGKCISERTVGIYMRELGIKAQYIKPYTITTIDSDFSNDLKNILDEQFGPKEPDAVWCSDITYIWTFAGFVYLTSIMDLFSRKIIAWVLSDTLEARWVIEAVNKAKATRNVNKPLIIHTDRGVQYVSHDYIRVTSGMCRSYSKKSYPWDNACIESFHPHIEADLKTNEIWSQVKLINSFAKLISCELQDEIRNAHMELMFDEDVLDGYFDFDEESREMAGLSALSGFQDYMEEYVSEHDQTGEIISVFEDISDEITKVEDLFAQYDDLLSAIDFEKLDQEKISSFQQHLGIEREECSLEDELKSLMDETEKEFLRLPDYLTVGENIKISTPSEKVLELSWSNYELNPESGETHTVLLQIIDAGIVIAESHIEITYGYMNFDEDGNAADGCGEDIEVNFKMVILALKEILKEYQAFVGKHNHMLDII
jgi:transposase InsO family protein